MKATYEQRVVEEREQLEDAKEKKEYADWKEEEARRLRIAAYATCWIPFYGWAAGIACGVSSIYVDKSAAYVWEAASLLV